LRVFTVRPEGARWLLCPAASLFYDVVASEQLSAAAANSGRRNAVGLLWVCAARFCLRRRTWRVGHRQRRPFVLRRRPAPAPVDTHRDERTHTHACVLATTPSPCHQCSATACRTPAARLPPSCMGTARCRRSAARVPLSWHPLSLMEAGVQWLAHLRALMTSNLEVPGICPCRCAQARQEM
jgi:hypothetical protein